jgi:hypothetical protein
MHALFSNIRIENATPYDAFRAGMIHALAYRQKQSYMRDNAFNIVSLRNIAQIQAEMYKQSIEDAKAINIIARVPEFETPVPLEQDDGYQDAGWVEFYQMKQDTLHIGWLYTVQSPHPVGSALLGHVIATAQAQKIGTITVNAVYPNSAKWFHERGLFGPYSPHKTLGAPLHLDRTQFAAARANLARLAPR